MILYMQITEDEYGLPVRMADRPTDLDDMLGRPHGSVSQSISRAKRLGEWCPFVRVDTENSFFEAEWSPPEKKCRRVAAYKMSGELHKVYDSLKEASEDVKRSEQTIRNCINGYQKQTGGFIWKWA